MNKNNFIGKMDLAVALTLFTGLSYILTYLFQIGKFHYYNIPTEFIDVGARDVFFTMILLGLPMIHIVWIIASDIYGKDSKVEALSNILSVFKNGNKEINKLKSDMNKIDKAMHDSDEELIDLKDEISNSISYIEERLEAKKDTLKLEEKKELEKALIKEKKNANRITIIEDGQSPFKNEVKNTKMQLDKIKRERTHYVSWIVVFIILFLSILIFFINAQKYSFVFITVISLLAIHGISWVRKKEKYGIMIIFVISLLLIYSVGVGISSSHSKESYITFETNEKSYVVLSVYKDQFLYVPLDRKTLEVKKTFNLIDIKDVKNFTKEPLGNIKM